MLDNGYILGLSAIYSTMSQAFDPPPSRRIAVKVINHFCDGALKVLEIKGAKRKGKEPMSRDPMKHAPDGYDAIFDANGVRTLSEGYERLAAGGRLVVYGFAEIFARGEETPSLLRLAWNRLRVPGFSPLRMTYENRGVMGFNVVNLFHRFEVAQKAMGRMLGWAAEGRLSPVPVREFPFERAADAHAALESGATTGKLVLTF